MRRLKFILQKQDQRYYANNDRVDFLSSNFSGFLKIFSSICWFSFHYLAECLELIIGKEGSRANFSAHARHALMFMPCLFTKCSAPGNLNHLLLSIDDGWKDLRLSCTFLGTLHLSCSPPVQASFE